MKDKGDLLENDVVRLESWRRRSNKSKQSQAAINNITDPNKVSAAFLNNLSVKDTTKNADLVYGVVRALASQKIYKKYVFQAMQGVRSI